MDNIADLNPTGQLGSFFENLFGPQKGYVYCPVTEPSNASECDHLFFKWPDQANDLVEHVLRVRANKEVYFSPVLFKNPELIKENVYGTKFLWAEFNGETPDPDDLKDFPTPSFKIRTSQKGHEYWFWELQFFQKDMAKIDDLNKRIAHRLKADLTAWHFESVLRPPNTIHHRSNQRTFLFEKLDLIHPEEVFEEIHDIPKYLTEENFRDIPPVSEVVAIYQFTKEDFNFFSKPEVEVGKRFKALTRLAFLGAEMGMENPEILALLLNADGRWKHFSDRKPEQRKARLIALINHVRSKKPVEAYRDTKNDYPCYDFGTFMKMDFKVEWALEPFVEKEGMTMISGDSNVGKTRFSLLFCIHMAIGKDFLGWKCPKPMKIQFWSLEMNHGQLKQFLEPLTSNLTEEELKLLSENFFPVPIGHSVHLDKPSQHAKANRLLDAVKPDGIVIDSLGVAVQDDIENAKIINAVFEYVNSQVRAERGAFVIWIHHHRKHGGGRPSRDDIFGSSYIVNQMTSIWTLHRIKQDNVNGDILEVTNPKQRLTENVATFRIRSDRKTIGYSLINSLDAKIQEAGETGKLDLNDNALKGFMGLK